ncbi:nickel pincer cofactor biosynthesis protein LarC [Roseimaritima sediminicola]|uniref:nickel pincer cofactor biosynthesis protein LarC n=1 Tax=Roseimaritima sediminicola TaxID=2662066 RepID=UPI00129826A1|nr:nickel pincer cofactor biosynthesis protein LarC [Roseimaritima sediminicola]
MRVAYFDCLSGISGDMTLGALIDAGASLERIVQGVRSLGLGELSITTEDVRKAGFRAVQVTITHPPEHAHRHLHHIEAMIDQADAISEGAKRRARDIFAALAAAEAKVHGTSIQKVHFHEVGAIDSIADIVGSAIALDDLEIAAVEASAVPTGTGFIQIDHGRVSIPAPATAELLCDIPIAASEAPIELTTPTGAAILKATARRFGSVPAMTPRAVGYGAGQKDLEGQANVLRVLVGELAEADGDSPSPLEYDRVTVLETNIDNTPAEDIAAACEAVLEAGALDVIQTPCVMKKGRSGVQVSVLCPEGRACELERILFLATGTIGIRRYRAERHKLARRSVTRETELGPVVGKECRLPDGSWRFAVEYEEAKAVADRHRLSVHQVREIAQRAVSP